MMNPYLHGAKKVKIGPFNSSETEIRDIIKAWAAISFAFTIALFGFSTLLGFAYGIVLSAVTVGLGFLLHELGHKIAAQRYGCFAEFRAFDQMLMLMILMSFFGFVFAAPGAVMISGPVGKRRNGIISVAGPAVNLVLAVVFLLGLIFVPIPLLGTIFFYGFIINTWLALFNMIPFWQFDGAKIWRWNRLIWGGMVFVGIVFLFSQGFFGLP